MGGLVNRGDFIMSGRIVNFVAMKSRGLIIKTVAALMCALLSGCIKDDLPEDHSLQPGDRVPAFSVTMSDGSTFSSSELQGKRGMIVFFNTECHDCRRELPKIQQAYDCVKDNPEYMVICIAREESEAEIAAYWRENDLTLPYSPQPDRAVYNLFATVSIPRVYLTNRDLVIEAVYDDTTPFDPDNL